MANTNIINIVQPNNKDVGQGLMPCVAEAERHRVAISKINAVLQVMDKSQPHEMTDENLDSAIAAEARALRAFLNIVPTSNPDAAAKVEYVLSAPELVETLPSDAMRQFLGSLLTFLASSSVKGFKARPVDRVGAPLAEFPETIGVSTGSVFMSPNEATKRLRISIPTLSRWRSNGEGPAYVKMGGKVYYRISDLEAFEEANKRTKTR